jgi:hypothetical protein
MPEAEKKYGRIKGVNSDYQFAEGKIEKVEPEPSEVYLKIFFCPYHQPSRLESEESYCEGTSAACPNEDDKSGHALIHLHQKEGIALVTDHALIHLHQTDGIRLVNDENHIAIKKDENIISLSPSADGRAEVDGVFVIKRKNEEEIFVEVSDGRISMQASGGPKVYIDGTGIRVVKQTDPEEVIANISDDEISMAINSGEKISLKADGGIELFTKDGSGTVTIHGNLEVTGDIAASNLPPGG